MKFLPTEDITYSTRLKEDEVIQRLSEIMEPKKAFRFGFFNSGSTRQYQGTINGQVFNIERIISYRNSFLPQISGTIEKDYAGTIIKVKMRLHIVVLIFICVWVGGVGLACIALLTKAFRVEEFDSSTFLPFGMLLFLYGLTMGGFKFESIKSKKYLQEIFQADIIEK